MSSVWDKLKTIRTCPFCGERPTIAIMQWPLGTDEFVWTVQCTHCGASGPNLPTQHEAVDAWEAGKWAHCESWDRRVKDTKQTELFQQNIG